MKQSSFRRVIRVVGAREHNLKNISVEIPKESLTVITGPSGSGKSTLAMDVLYAEGQRRYLESLSSYARQFLGMPKKPDVDRIEGLCPSIAIDQKTVGSNPRSTVGTITEIYDYLRVLFARIGVLHCPQCSARVHQASPDTVTELLLELYKGQFATIAAPVVIHKKGEFGKEITDFFKQGFTRFSIDGEMKRYSSLEEVEKIRLAKTHRHTIDVLIDAIDIVPEERARIGEALDRAFKLANGMMRITFGAETHLFSEHRMCVTCGLSFPEIEPRLFSFNSPIGACHECSGLGFIIQSDWEMFRDSGTFAEKICPSCHGKRLNDFACAITVGGKSIVELSTLSIENLLKFFNHVQLSHKDAIIAERLKQEIIHRITFLSDVGLSYLTLGRQARTLSGGESQRIRLATQIGSALSGVVYVLDEPSIGLHQRDNTRLIATLKKLRDQGNTIVVVEHDHETMEHADHIIDMGPAAGYLGGAIVAEGTPEEIKKNPQSLTGAYLSGRKAIVPPVQPRVPRNWITLNDAVSHNLKNITVRVPTGILCGISGVSGSGKSTLIMEELVPSLRSILVSRNQAYQVSKIEKPDDIQNLVVIDQSPIGRTPRSNPATYLGIFDDIRRVFAASPESNARGYTVGRFSFNVAEGRCSECSGEGSITVSMHFLPDVVMTCTRCKGLRYNPQTLEILYRGKNIAQVLEMTMREALDFFAAHTTIARRLQLVCDVGLDYLKLGQPSTTLSGGEAQRIKLVDELAKRGSNTLYILDEPTTGLHTSDVERLLGVFNKLIDKGNSLVVIEHNLDMLASCDYLIDLGPEGGDAGGMIVAQGTPREVTAVAESYTGQYLKPLLK